MIGLTTNRTLKSILVIFLTGMLFSCENDIDQIKALTDDFDFPVQTVKNGTYHYTEKSELTNTLIASILKRYEGESPRIEVEGGFEMLMYDSLETVSAILSGERATYYDIEGRLEARENVVFKNNEGAILKTEELIWLQDSDKVYTTKLVEITNADGTIFSKGMTTNSKFSFYRLWEVNGDILIDQPEKEEKNEP